MRSFLGGFSAAVLSVGLVTPAAAERFTLADALALTYSTNPELEAQRARVRQADSVVAEARGNWRPRANGSASYGGASAQGTGEFFSSIPVPRSQTLGPIDARASLSQPGLN